MSIYDFWKEIGYEPKTNVWDVFSLAEIIGGTKAVKECFDEISQEFKNNYELLTELVLVMNHKIWTWYEKDDKMGRLYDSLWRLSQEIFFKEYTNNETAMHYYFKVTD